MVKHLDDIGESYFQHLLFTAVIALQLFLASFLLLLHGLLPFIFVSTTSGIVDRLHARLMVRRAQRPARPS